LIGRTNNNSVDLNRDFPDLDRLLYADEDGETLGNNHLMDRVRLLDHPVKNYLAFCLYTPFLNALMVIFHNSLNLKLWQSCG